MIISDKSLKKLITEKILVCEPLTPESIQPASIDCRLGNDFLVVDSLNQGTIRMDQEINYRKIEGNSVVIPPNTFILGTTKEYIELPDNIIAFVEGRSSIGRLGLFIQNAGWVDPGFKGQITLELYNANTLPIELKTGQRICQLVFGFMDESAELPYGSNQHGGKYQNQKGTVGSKVFADKDR